MKKQFTILPKIAALSVMAAFAAPVMAQSAGSNIVSVGWFHLAPQDSSEGITGVSGTLATALNSSGRGANAHSTVGNADTIGLALTHFFTDNIALTLDGGIPPTFHLKGQGNLASQGEIGKAKQWSPALVAKYYFGDANDKFRPFVGAGATYVWYSNVELSSGFQTYTNNLGVFTTASGTATAKLSSSLAPVFTVGGSYNLTDKWSVGLSVSYIPLKTDATVTATGTTGTNVYKTRLTINPIVSFLSVGYKF
jgi:outer membrane protein